jgi:hypothetical protein
VSEQPVSVSAQEQAPQQAALAQALVASASVQEQAP